MRRPGAIRRHRRFHQGDSDRPEFRRRLYQSRARLSPDAEGRARARRFQSGARRQSQPRPSLPRPRQSLRSQGHLPEALADLNQAIRLNPEGAQAFHARGLIYQRQGNHPQAITDFNNAIDRDPFAGAPYQARGQSLIATGKYDAAIDDFNAALNVDPKNADAWAGLGVAYEKMNNKTKAMESYSARWKSALATRSRATGWRLAEDRIVGAGRGPVV